MNTDENILSVWYEGLVKAERNPELKQQLLQREHELLPRFAAHYAKLKRLPRRMRRRLQRHWKQSLAGVALLFALGAAPASAATINVGGVCTLIRAINAANNDTTATGHCKKGGGADLIVMPRNSTVTLTTVNDTTFGPTGLPTIRTNITIDGNGSTVKRASTAPKFRIFAVGHGASLTLQETTISGGVAARGSGGGIYNCGGKLNLSNSTLSGNRAYRGGGLGIEGYMGNLGFDPVTTVTNSIISSNSAAAFGGGVDLQGVPSYSPTLNITNSTVSGNKARDGGGVNIDYYTGATVTSSTISGNVARRSGGGVNNVDIAGIDLTNSSVSGNKAGRSGGGVFNYRAEIDLLHSTVTGNTAGVSGGGIYNGDTGYGKLVRGLISGNTAAKGAEIYFDESSTITAANFNVFGRKGETRAQAFVGFTPSGTDITATSDGNRPTALNRILNITLANNGGRTRTHALVAGSPAVDAVNDGTCPPPARDQRGVKRPRDGNGDGGPACDVGSFER